MEFRDARIQYWWHCARSPDPSEEPNQSVSHRSIARVAAAALLSFLSVTLVCICIPVSAFLCLLFVYLFVCLFLFVCVCVCLFTFFHIRSLACFDNVCAVSVSEGQPIGKHECWLSVDENKLCGVAGTARISVTLCVCVSLCVTLLPTVYLSLCVFLALDVYVSLRLSRCGCLSLCVSLSYYVCLPGSARIPQSALEIGTMKKEYIDTLWCVPSASQLSLHAFERGIP